MRFYGWARAGSIEPREHAQAGDLTEMNVGGEHGSIGLEGTGGDQQVGFRQLLVEKPAGTQLAAELLVVGEVKLDAALELCLQRLDRGLQVMRLHVAQDRGLDSAVRKVKARETVVGFVSILAVAMPWLFLRVRFFRRKWTAITLAATPAGEQLLALRALANRPLAKLAAVSIDPVGAWRRDDVVAVRGLANLELRAAGVTRRH